MMEGGLVSLCVKIDKFTASKDNQETSVGKWKRLTQLMNRFF